MVPSVQAGACAEGRSPPRPATLPCFCTSAWCLEAGCSTLEEDFCPWSGGCGTRAAKDSPLSSQRCWESRLCSPQCPHESEVLFSSLVDISGSMGVRLPRGRQRRRGRLRHGRHSPWVHPKPLHASVVQEPEKQHRVPARPGDGVRARSGP